MDNQEMINRFITEVPIRMSNLKKYFPYFELYKLNSKKYPDLDICSIVIGLLGYLLQEVEIRRKVVAFTEIKDFINEYTLSMYNKTWDDEDSLKEFTNYILSKLQNDGEPFMYKIFNVEHQKTEEHIVRYITYTYDDVNKKNHYSITSEGIDFYLQTKEFGDESKVTIHLLLLQKMLDDNDYQSALNQVININTEVRKLIIRKKDIVYALLNNGRKSEYLLDEYKNSVMTRFEEEKILFESTKLTVDLVFEEHIKNIDLETMSNDEIEAIKVLERIKEELKNTIELHGCLISETLGLNHQSELIFAEKRGSAFKEKFNFQNFLQGVSSKDNISLLKNVIAPLLAPKIDNIFAEDRIEEMELCRKKEKREEENDEANSGKNTELETLDNIVDKRLISNYRVFFLHFFKLLTISSEFKTTDYIKYIKENHSSRPVENPDFHSFLSQLYKSANGTLQDFPSKFHDLRHYVKNYGKHDDKKDSKYHIEDLMVDVLKESDEFTELKKLKIEVRSIQGEYISVTETSEITNYIIKKVEQ